MPAESMEAKFTKKDYEIIELLQYGEHITYENMGGGIGYWVRPNVLR